MTTATDSCSVHWPVVIGANAGECPDGYAHINTREACRAAADAVGAGFSEGSWNDATHVINCFAETSTHVYWNGASSEAAVAR